MKCSQSLARMKQFNHRNVELTTQRVTNKAELKNKCIFLIYISKRIFPGSILPMHDFDEWGGIKPGCGSIKMQLYIFLFLCPL